MITVPEEPNSDFDDGNLAALSSLDEEIQNAKNLLQSDKPSAFNLALASRIIAFRAYCQVHDYCSSTGLAVAVDTLNRLHTMCKSISQNYAVMIADHLRETQKLEEPSSAFELTEI